MIPTVSPQASPKLTTPAIAKILVALDYPIENPQILPQALDLAEKFQAQLQIFHCIQPISMPELSSVMAYGGMMDPTLITLPEDQFEHRLNEVAQWLDQLIQTTNDRHITVTAEHKIGEPNQEICAIAKEWDADLIILGRRGLQGIGEVLMGSVSNYVLHHAPCSIMVVQNKKTQTQ